MLSDIHLPDPVRNGDLYDDLSGNIVVVSSVTRDDHGFALVLGLRERVKDRLHEVFKIMLLSENLYFFTKSTRSWLLVHVWLFDWNHFL